MLRHRTPAYEYCRLEENDLRGGLNVYSWEADLVLTDHAAVEGLVIANIPSECWGEGAVAFVILADGSRVDWS